MQLVFTDLPDKAALKLTIAQYLTEPGDVSIQGVGRDARTSSSTR